MLDFLNLNITIIGLGVIGGSFAKSLTKRGFSNIYGVDTNHETIKIALEEGIVKEAYASPEKILEKTDILILSLYPNSIKDYILQYKDSFKDNMIITDVSGIKTKIIDELKPIIPENVDFIFGHPMAGREKKGIEFSDSEVFNNANYIIIKEKDNKESNLQILEAIFKIIGFKNISYLTKEEHDEIIAFTSQLTHAIAVSLINSDTNKYDTNKYIGDSYRDLTRIARINEDLWSELFMNNKENLIKMINNFELELEEIKNSLNNNDYDKLKKIFIESTKRKEKISN